MLKRKIIDRLEKWYQSGHYKAPLVFGARQVGKTTARHNLPPIVYGIIDIGKVFGNATFLRCFSKNNANPFQNRFETEYSYTLCQCTKLQNLS